MKCLVLSVLVIVAVFTVNCRDVPGHPEGSSKAQRLEEETAITELGVTAQHQGRTINSQQLVEIDIAVAHHKERAEDHENEIRKSKCKDSSSCVIMGGSCIDDASLCEGRLVAGCKGKQCQCCVPEPVNICVSDAADNSSFWRKIDTAEESIKATCNQGNTNVTRDVEIKLQGMESQLNTMANTLEDIVTKLQDIIPIRKRCSLVKGFMSPTEDQCFVLFVDQLRNWEDAKSKCLSEGLQMAKPKTQNHVWLRKYIFDNRGNGDHHVHAWLGARADGSYMRWDCDQEIFPSGSSLWYPGYPGSRLTTTFCLLALLHSSQANGHPNSPYFSWECTNTAQTVCEVI